LRRECLPIEGEMDTQKSPGWQMSRAAAARAPRTPLFYSWPLRAWLGGIVTLAYSAAWLGRRWRGLSVWLRAALPVVIVLGVICSTTDSPAGKGELVSSFWLRMPLIAGATLLLTLLAWGLRVRRQISVHEFVVGGASSAQAPDGEGKNSKRTGPATGLSTLLVVELARLHNLQVAINELSTTFRDAGTAMPRLMTNDAPLLAPADVGDSTMRVGVVTVPLRAIVALVERLARGPRLQGAVFAEGDNVALVLQLTGREAKSWRVDACARTADGAREAMLGNLIARAALRIHADLYLGGVSTGAATDAFVAGLRASRRAARAGGADQRHQFERARRQYKRASAADTKFGLAFYNLGVDYTTQLLDEAAAHAFGHAIERCPDDWRPYYALGLHRALQARALLKPTAAEYRCAVEKVIDRTPADWSDAERILCAVRRDDAGRTLDATRVLNAWSDLDEAEQLALRVGSRPVGTRPSRRFQKIRGRYLLGLVHYFRGVAADGCTDAAGHSIEAARAQAGSVRAGTWLLLRESWRKGTVAVWPRDAATDILARLGEAFGQVAQSVDEKRQKRPQRCMHVCFRAAIRLQPHDAGLFSRDAEASLRIGGAREVKHGVRQLVTAVSFCPDQQDYRQGLAEAIRRQPVEQPAWSAGMAMDKQVRAILERSTTRPHPLRRLALTLALAGRGPEARAALDTADRRERKRVAATGPAAVDAPVRAVAESIPPNAGVQPSFAAR
jgi:hypothetical protein